jgi:hypothetical protein
MDQRRTAGRPVQVGCTPDRRVQAGRVQAARVQGGPRVKADL